MASLYDNIKEIMEQGITDTHAIKTELTRRFNKNPSNNTISTTKSFVKKSIKVVNSDNISNNNNPTNISNLPNNSENQLSSENQDQQLQNQENQKENQAPIIENTFYKQPLPSIKANSTLNINGNTADLQPEALEISNAYQGADLENSEQPKKLYQVKIDRVGEIMGEVMGVMYETKTMQNLTHGFKPDEKDLKILSNDMSDVLKNRVTGIESEYGDLINIGISTGLLFGKSIFHRFKNPKLKEELLQASNEVEQQFIRQQEEAQRIAQLEIQNIEIPKEKNKVGCNNCNNPDQYKDGLCLDCWFKMELKRGAKEMNKAIDK